jgi:hypothetical protein
MLFERKVLTIVSRIPVGRVTTCGDIARLPEPAPPGSWQHHAQGRPPGLPTIASSLRAGARRLLDLQMKGRSAEG